MQHARSAAVAQAACYAICKLCHRNSDNPASVGAHGGIEAVFSSIKQHTYPQRNQADIGACCGVEAVIEAYEKYADNTAQATKDVLYNITWENPATLRMRYEEVARGGLQGRY